jgi:hypothetical protein
MGTVYTPPVSTTTEIVLNVCIPIDRRVMVSKVDRQEIAVAYMGGKDTSFGHTLLL